MNGTRMPPTLNQFFFENRCNVSNCVPKKTRQSTFSSSVSSAETAFCVELRRDNKRVLAYMSRNEIKTSSDLTYMPERLPPTRTKISYDKKFQELRQTISTCF